MKNRKTNDGNDGNDIADVSLDIKSFIANELEDGVLNEDGSIDFTWEGKRYTGTFSVNVI